VLAQSGSPQAREILGKIARGQSNPELQRKAVEYLDSSAVLKPEDAGGSLRIKQRCFGKHAILRSYMIGGDHDRLFAAAKSEKDESLRREAIRQLGLVQRTSELEQLYKTETSSHVRREILQAFFLAGDREDSCRRHKEEKDAELRGPRFETLA